MMTIKVAEHLNKLHGRTRHKAEHLGVPFDDSEAAGELLEAVMACVPAGIDAEIRRAATEHRTCTDYSQIMASFASRYHHWQLITSDRHTNALTRAILEAAKPAIEAVYARWAADYEQYRLACEQGVAIAPES